MFLFYSITLLYFFQFNCSYWNRDSSLLSDDKNEIETILSDIKIINQV